MLFCGIQLGAISQEVLMNVIYNMFCGITLLKLLPRLHGVNELIIGTVYNWVTMAPKIIKYQYVPVKMTVSVAQATGLDA